MKVLVHLCCKAKTGVLICTTLHSKIGNDEQVMEVRKYKLVRKYKIVKCKVLRTSIPLHLNRGDGIVCRYFTTGSGRYWETFMTSGFCDWKHAMGKDGIISCHDRCKTHMQAMVAWQEYTKNKTSGTSITHRLDAARSQLIAKNRHYLKTILQVFLVCSQQEIALRGYDE